MDPLSSDLRDTLDESYQANNQASSASDLGSSTSGEVTYYCYTCGSLPAPGQKLRYCGRCEGTKYCSKQCAKADWGEHKLVCESTRRAKGVALANLEAQRSRKAELNQGTRDSVNWLNKQPGLKNEIRLLAWKYHKQSPIVLVLTSQGDGGDGLTRVKLLPRRFWEVDPRFLDTYPDTLRTKLQHTFGTSHFWQNNHS